MTTARDFFERVRAASKDAESCNRQLAAMESRALSLGSQGFEPRVRSTGAPDRMQRRSNAYMDREGALERRMQDDYDMIDRGCLVIYGSDEVRGLDSVVSPVWADILWWRYLDDAKWDYIAGVVDYSVRPCQLMRDQALRWIDENRFMSAVIDA